MRKNICKDSLKKIILIIIKIIQTDKYALYRHVYLFGCQEILRRFTESAPNMAQQNPDLSEKIGNVQIKQILK
jgi:hypothetical protein